VVWLVANPEAGDVIPRSGGCRKVRWNRPGMGKRGGVRVIHYNRLADGVIYLLRQGRGRQHRRPGTEGDSRYGQMNG